MVTRYWDKSKPPLGPFTLNRDCIAAQGLVFWSAMNGGGGFIPDLSSSNRSGVFTGGSRTLNPSGAPSIYLTGAGRVDFGTPVVTPTNAVTVICSIIIGVLSRSDWVTTWSSGGGNSQWNLLHGLTSGKPQFYISNGSGTLATSGVGSTAMAGGPEYRIAGTYDGANVSVGLNGIVQASAASSLTMGTGAGRTLIVGNNSDGNGQANGWITDVRIYDRAFSADSLYQDYAPGTRFELWYPLRSKKWISISAGGGFQSAWARNANSVIQGMRI